MLTFHLFRVIAQPKREPSLFDQGDLPPNKLILHAILECPSAKIRSTWHIGNVEKLGKHQLFFAFGKTTKATIDSYNEKERRFEEQEVDEAPWTPVLADLAPEHQLLVIAEKTKLGRTPVALANALQHTLNSTNAVSQDPREIHLKPVRDPKGFVGKIMESESLRRVTFRVNRPNLIDVERDFLKPMQKSTAELGADKGEASFSGDSLDKNAAANLAKEVAASGGDVSARIIRRKGNARGETIRMKEEISATIQADPIEITSRGGKKSLLKKALDLLRRIRHD